MLELSNLRLLHKDMHEKGEFSTVFNIQIKEKSFSCIFTTNTEPYYLYMATVGANIRTFEFEILYGYQINTLLSNDVFRRLCDYLEIKFDPNHKFSTTDLFKLINNKIPTVTKRRPTPTEVLNVVSNHREIEEQNKTYFMGFKHLPNGQTVSQPNYEKTRFIFGEKKATEFRQQRISTCWTDKQGLQNIELLNKHLAK